MEDLLFPSRIAGLGSAIQLFADGSDGVSIVEKAQSFEEGIPIEGWEILLIRFFDEKMEAINKLSLLYCYTAILLYCYTNMESFQRMNTGA